MTQLATTSESLRPSATIIRSHNQQAARVWHAGGGAYEAISQQIADAIEHCVGRLAPRPGERVLDVATGTGLAARLCARRGAHVSGVDFAPSAIARARQLADADATRASLPIAFREGDAEQLPYADGEFDAVVSTFGVMFVNRPEAAAAEIARVLKPGGRVALATWPRSSTVFEMFKVIAAHKPAPPAGAKAPPSPFEWGRTDRLVELFGEHFDLAFEHGTSQYRDESGARAWQVFVDGYGPLRTLVNTLAPEQVAALRLDWERFHERYRTGLGILVPREYCVMVGQRR
ncbi:MAG: class I SAM-dependent methyltransferase [Myxococcales bacterium]|nr:class I SAM-dependent methyltransferase [Myxococcales bacterium]